LLIWMWEYQSMKQLRPGFERRYTTFNSANGILLMKKAAG
jgi:hypothetical protein